MKKKETNFITDYQLFSSIVVTIIGVGIFSYSNNMATEVNTDGWLITIISGGIFALISYMIYKIVELNDYKPFYDILKDNFGKILGKIISILFVIGNILYIAIGMRVFAEVLKMYLLEKTPIEFILVIMIVVGSYLVRGELDNVIRFNEISFWIMFIPIYIVFILLVKEVDFTNILPILNNKPINYMNGFFHTFFVFGGVTIAYLLLPNTKNKKHSSRIILKSVIFIAIFYVVISIFCLGIFGVEQNKKLIWPTLTMIKSINIPGAFIEQWEGIVMTFWIIFYMTTFVNMYYFSIDILKDVFRFEDIKFSSYIFAPIVYLAALFPEDIASTYALENILGIINEGFSIILLTIVLLIISVVRKKKKG